MIRRLPPWRSALREARTPVVVRNRTARSERLSAGRTTWTCQPYGAGLALCTRAVAGTWEAADCGATAVPTTGLMRGGPLGAVPRQAAFGRDGGDSRYMCGCCAEGETGAARRTAGM